MPDNDNLEFTTEERVAICEALMLALGISNAFEADLRDAAGTAYGKVFAAAWNASRS